ncbi:uncharacterized protein LOC113345268 [Papaver somniferum]|uniref:uncharacterized protein LOC113345268 n=1 Tax=Papaver somniferum TaxID=3469 RepID=UPI000E704C8F|nr:uncharacterized protein LOC113345268 [Papaver somniferum]
MDPVKFGACEILSKYFGSNKTSSQASLEKEVETLKENLRLESQKLQNVSLDCNNLRKKNEELRESEKGLRSTISTLEAKVAKIYEENAHLTSLVTSTRDQAERRLDYLSHFKDIQDRNHQREFLRQVHLKAEVLVNEILLSQSLPPVSVDPLEVDDDEIPRPADSDFDYPSGNESILDEDEEGTSHYDEIPHQDETPRQDETPHHGEKDIPSTDATAEGNPYVTKTDESEKNIGEHPLSPSSEVNIED